MTIKGVGVDIVESDNFAKFKRKPHDRFLTGNFSKRELKYCFSFRDPIPHLAGIFAAKEAAFKTLGKKILQSSIEVRRRSDGSPEIWIKNTRQKTVFISISHCKKYSVAMAVRL